jgi:hypothetical protein
MLFKVKNVIALDDYELEIEFTNCEIRIMDMKPYLNLPIFKELNDTTLFNKVKVAFNTVQWENGADFDPDSLYSLSNEIVKEMI